MSSSKFFVQTPQILTLDDIFLPFRKNIPKHLKNLLFSFYKYKVFLRTTEFNRIFSSEYSNKQFFKFISAFFHTFLCSN